ncbi:LamG domain-containing protein, partial [Candidatus Woesearchaeota archaeon]|nr:LamG domain-containing protein [Candidatus Woesearchaeota archaeon]
GDDSRTYWWFRIGQNQKADLTYRSGSGGNGGVQSNASLGSGEWAYICASYDSSDSGNELKIYINGTFDSQAAEAGSLNDPLTETRIGSFQSSVQFMDGVIDELTMQTTVRNSSFINQTYQNALGTTGFGAPLVKESKAAPTSTPAYMNYNNVGNFTALGNIIATYFIGDGSLLTGIFDTWWPLKSGGYLVNDSNQLDIDESKLNETIDARNRPNYDSGWVSVSQNEFKQVTHNLGGDIEDYVVDVTAKNNDTGINNLYTGLDKDNSGNVKGWYYLNLTSTGITLYRAANDIRAPELRVRIWKY